MVQYLEKLGHYNSSGLTEDEQKELKRLKDEYEKLKEKANRSGSGSSNSNSDNEE